jgi:carboxypeptidase family protein/TonB-dependent receptor-like protein
MTRCLLSLILRGFLLSCLFLVTQHSLVSTVHAQSSTATLSGTVRDPNNATIPGAHIAVTNTATGLKREATTNSAGMFTISLLPPSTYTVLVENPGFTPAEIKDVVLNVNDNVALNIQLKIGQVGASIDVKDEAPLINESSSVGTVVDRHFVANLPLNGRSFQSLIELTPGVVMTSATGGEQGQFSVNGQRANANYFTVDGVSANVGASAGPLGQSAGGTLPGLSASGGTNNLVSVDALQEFSIQTSTYAPEFGRSPGAQVSIVTRSGTNDFRGSVFEYFRDEALDANDWFNNSRALPKPPLRQHNFGGVIGGPLILPRFGEGGPSFISGENRTFFFFSYEGLRLQQPKTLITVLPSAATRKNAPIQLQPILNAFPVTTGPDLGNGLAEYAATFSDPTSLDATSLRLDHRANDNLTFFGRYNDAPSSTRTRGLIGSANNITDAQFKTQTLTVGTSWLISPEMNNDLRVNWSKNNAGSVLSLDNFGGAVPAPNPLLFPVTGTPADSLFTFIILGPNIGYGVGTNSTNAQRQFNVVDNLSIITGSHQLKFGVDYRSLTPTFGSRKSDLQVLFNGTAGISTGTTLQVSATGREAFSFSFTNFSAFAQDTWKLNPRLTFTYGLRWEVNPAPKGRDGKELLTVNSLANLPQLALAPAGTPLWKTTYDNFAPRVGISYQLTQTSGRETVIRGGFGVFHDTGAGQIGDSVVFAPYVRSRSTAGASFPLVNTSIAVPPAFSLNPPFSTFYTTDPDLKLPYTYQWNLAVERSLGANQTVTASYVAAAGRRLLRQDVVRNPNASFSTVRVTRNTATSDYHSLQVQFQRRLTQGFQALGSYTWSHSIDTASNDSSLNASLTLVDVRGERAASSFDVRHSFVGAVTYNLPKPELGLFGNAITRDWSIDAIFRTRTATPVDVIAGRDVASSGVTTAWRPDLVTGVPLYIESPSLPGGRAINKAAFFVPVGRQGSLGRNALRGFGVSQVDLALRRQVNLTETVNIQFRAEFFNLFNHPNFALPTNTLTNAFFGQPTQMLGRSMGAGGISGGFNPLYQIGGPRSTQLALKLQF